jgi:hypothetical protein
LEKSSIPLIIIVIGIVLPSGLGVKDKVGWSFTIIYVVFPFWKVMKATHCLKIAHNLQYF